MHQPDYRGSDGVMKMPWVFLHAIKDYYEMPWLLSRYKGLKATFNITAPLIEQLNLYRNPLKNDYFLSLWEAHPLTLDPTSKGWLIKTCKSTQYETMVKPLPYFDRLYHQEHYTDDEFIDFEMMFMLSWCGNYLRQENGLVRELFARGSGYSQSDKRELLHTLCHFLESILPFYAQLQKDGIISVSTTPYNHPILPLLLDINNAHLANEHTALPDHPLCLKEDALEQVERSIKLYEETFGRKPTGFWPAEGAVDEASIDIYREHGLRWIATDEAILFKSLGDETRSKLYKPYRFKGMNIGFRDHGLSDLIGFTYRFKSGHDATEHFVYSLETIAKETENPTVLVILDGENAWEFFENNAYDFFTTLYQRLSVTSWCTTATMDDVSKLKDFATLDKLAPGSWIHGTFDTWSGDPEKNRAWELIYQTRRDVDNFSAPMSEDLAEKIRFHFLASECSDWFWWYGDDHVTEFSIEFDTLFREHLITIYRLLGMEPPADLFIPISGQKNSASFWIKPQKSITPVIDGKNVSFFDWLGSGSIDERKMFSTMDRVRGPIDIIHYGHNASFIFLAFEGNMASFQRNGSFLYVTIEESGEKLSFSLMGSYHNNGDELAIDERMELALSRVHFQAYDTVHLRFEIVQDNRIIQTMPGYGSLPINVNETYADNWFI
jgi:alpha-amylase/alpha-mannosidase (GH57 family)